MTKAEPLECAVLRFGPFEIDVVAGELRRAGRLIKLQPQPFRLLALLARRRGELVTREEIREQLWGEQTFVDFEQGENHCIRLIRLALGDDARSPRFVETVPRRGYRFIGGSDEAPAIFETTPGTVPIASLPTSPEPPLRRRPWHPRVLVALALLAVGVALVVQHGMTPPASTCPRVAVMPFVCLNGDSRDGLAGGLTYEITTELVRRGRDGIIVVSTLSSSRSLDTSPGRQGVRPIDADFLLEGSVQSVENRVRVTVQITDARRLTPIWAESYERPAGDVLALRSALTRDIVAQVQAKLSRRRPDTGR